jgi:hypothetical protein
LRKNKKFPNLTEEMGMQEKMAAIARQTALADDHGVHYDFIFYIDIDIDVDVDVDVDIDIDIDIIHIYIYT